MNNQNTNPSKTFCILPWIHLHAWPDGRAMLCCIANNDKTDGKVGDFSKNTYAEIINSDELKQIRTIQNLIPGLETKEYLSYWSSTIWINNLGEDSKTNKYVMYFGETPYTNHDHISNNHCVRAIRSF